METKIAVFKGQGVRKTIHNNEWWFVINDVVAVLTDSVQPDGYIKDMRRRDPELSQGWGQIATPLAIETAGERRRDEVDTLSNPLIFNKLRKKTGLPNALSI